MITIFCLLLMACGSKPTPVVQPVSPPPVTNPGPSPGPTPPPTEPPTATSPDFVAFESVPVRPMVKVDDRLFVTNTQDNRIEVFEITDNQMLIGVESFAVGMEPVAVAARNDSELWVVNHLSDSISVVDIASTPIRIKRTLLVGDEPRDIVFAQDKAFITTARRGQHRTHSSLIDVPGAGDPLTHTSGIARADVWVFDADNLGSALGGKPIRILELFGDTPRALAVSNDQKTIYVAIFNSGNQTSVAHEGVLCYGFSDDDPTAPYSGAIPCKVKDGITSPNGLVQGWLPGGRTAPGTNIDGVPQPWTSMIVKYNQVNGQWEDSLGRNFSNAIRFTLPDNDVFAIDVNTLNTTGIVSHVGTTLFNMVVNPVNRRLYVTNTESNNHIRFEGPGIHGQSTVQGRIALSRISVINTDMSVKARHLNSHIDYSILKSNPATKQHSIATPLQMDISTDGQHLYVAALGSNKVAVYNTQDLELDEQWIHFDPTTASANHLTVSGGPVGVLLNQQTNHLYVLTRFDHSVVVMDLNQSTEIQRIPMHNPEPPEVIAGRVMLYDAQRTSSNGEASCASCHVFGDVDQLAWNLGNPDASNSLNPQLQPTRNMTELDCAINGQFSQGCLFLSLVNGDGNLDGFATMKGPMTTQTFRGMSTHGHMHWRGDRSNGYFGVDTEQSLEARLSFKNFIVAFEGLLGMDIELPESVDTDNKSNDVLQLEMDMDKFADFGLALQLPPNPHIGLDRTHSASAAIGRSFFHGERRSDGLDQDYDFNGPEVDGVNCAGCHTLDPSQGFFGTDGSVAHGGEIQMFKVPHLRNLYQKVGMFGLPDREGFLPSTTKHHQGDQVRGFGFLHDGATDRLFNFLQGAVFDNGELGCAPGQDASHGCELNVGFVGIPDDTVRLGLVDYLMEFDTDLAPIVGQQITLSDQLSHSAIHERIMLLETRAAAPFVSKILGGEVTDCDLIAQGVINHEAKAYLYDTQSKLYVSDRSSENPMVSEELRKIATTNGNSITFTCVPPGSGYRAALDRDRDGLKNRDEIVLGENPAAP